MAYRRGLGLLGGMSNMSPSEGLRQQGIRRASLGRRPLSTSSSRIKFGLATGGAALGAIGLMKLTMGAERFRRNIVRGLYPNTASPAGGGKFGANAGPAAPAGIDGLKFNFRRK